MMNNAPGLKIIITIFIIVVSSILLYFLWYFKIARLTSEKLNYIQKNLKEQNISFTWDEDKKSGFPYRIETNLKNINIKFKKTDLYTSSINIIYQPWNKNHLLFKFPNDINILYEDKNIRIQNSNILASLVIDNNYQKRISLISDSITIIYNKTLYHITKPKLYFKTENLENIQYIISIDKLIYPPLFINNNILSQVYIKGRLLKYNEFNIKNYIKWFNNQGGINIDQFTVSTKNTNIIGNGFISLDKNTDIQSSFSLKSNSISNFISILEANTNLSKEILNTSKFIIKTVEATANLSNKTPEYSINIQNGYLNLMGIKLLTIPNLNSYF